MVLKSIRDSERHGSRHSDDEGNVIHQHVPYCSCHEPNCAASSLVNDEVLLLHLDAHCSTVVMLCFDDVYSLYGLVLVVVVVVVPSPSPLLSSREEGDHVIHPVEGDDAEFCT